MNYELTVERVQVQIGEGRVIVIEGLRVNSSMDPQVWIRLLESINTALDAAGTSVGLEDLERLFRN